MQNFYVSQFLGYENKRDITNQQPGVLISGSRNVVSTDGDTVAIRQGYTEFGAEQNDLFPIESSYEWQKLRKGLIALRSYDDELEFYWSSELGGDGEWYRVNDGWSAVDFSFAPFYDATEVDDQLLFVNGDNNIYTWSGGIATFDSATVNTVTLEGATNWAAQGFVTSGTRAILVLDDGGTWREVEYTGGETTDTLTGLNDDLTAYVISQGALVIQAVRTTSNKPASAAPFTNDIIRVLNNQAIIGSHNDRTIYISAVGDITDYTPSNPRLPGEGTSITLDAAPVDIIVPNDGESKNVFYVSAGNDFWFQVNLQLSSDLTNESIFVNPLKVSTDGAVHNQGAVTFVKNFIAYVSKEPTLDFLGRVQDINTPQSKPLSDRIKTDFDGYDFTNCHLKYYRNNLYIALPAESILLVYNFEKGFWEAPWDLPVRRLAVINGDLIIHSNSTPSSYKLFDTYADNENPINAIARFSYQNMGERMKYKNMTMPMLEGRMTEPTTLTTTILYEDGGAGSAPAFDTEGTEQDIFFRLIDTGGSLGDETLGEQSLGGGADETEGVAFKFRKFKKLVKQNFFECSFQFSSNEANQQWEIISFGGGYTQSSDYPIRFIK